MAVTFKEVAKLAGVSTQTVSRVTNGADNVAEETRQRVNAAIKQLGYVPNKGAQMLSRAQSRIIGIVSLDISLHGVALITNGIRHQAHDMDYATALAVLSDNSIDEYRSAVRELIAQQVELVIVNAPSSREIAESLVEQFAQLTFVFIDVPEEAAVNQVNCDHKAGAQLAISHLIAQDHKAFLCISGPKASTAARIRLNEWQTQIHTHGLTLVACYEGDWQAQSGYHAIKTALLKGESFDAVLVGNDQMALGVLCALSEFGIKVPQMVSVVGFDGIQDSQFFSPPLTTVKQDFRQLGRQAVKLAINTQAQEQGMSGDMLPVSKVLPVSLEVRQSCAQRSQTQYDKVEIMNALEHIKRLLP
ncbi:MULTISPECIES: LacI family DNA-binding transcriptional regulator [unclassified Vibrio]|uniref:LacI family DNA-binding transcriptional regulator n=1 Tax=Vibrio sp. HB236076 TaxID=3232307 RepID=A0AB39HJZ7_9VIBR|nr:LacI family DNA-binding transcriptional regulator [Vibrio sp. HB161653]MDP5252546.1 LacI family DNA-binding transcriptional regulator [Vibrio sp. HB161653]